MEEAYQSGTHVTVTSSLRAVSETLTISVPPCLIRNRQSYFKNRPLAGLAFGL